PVPNAAAIAAARSAASRHSCELCFRAGLRRAYSRCKHLSSSTEHYTRLPGARPRHYHHYEPYSVRGRGKGRARDTSACSNLRNDADRLPTSQVRSTPPPPHCRSCSRGSLVALLAGLVPCHLADSATSDGRSESRADEPPSLPAVTARDNSTPRQRT